MLAKKLTDAKQATIAGALLWVLIFVEISVLMFAPPLVGKEMLQILLHFLILPFLTLFVVKMYFEKTKAKKKEWLFLGVYMVVVGIVLDLLVTVPLFTGLEIFTRWNVWVGFLIALGVVKYTAEKYGA